LLKLFVCVLSVCCKAINVTYADNANMTNVKYNIKPVTNNNQKYGVKPGAVSPMKRN